MTPPSIYVIMTKKNEVVYVRHNLLTAKRYATKRGYVRIGVLDSEGYLVRVWWKGYRKLPKGGSCAAIISRNWSYFTPGKVKPTWRR